MKGGSHAKEWGTIRIPFRRWISQDGRKRLGIPKINFNARSSFTRKVRNDVLQGESDGSQLSDNKRVTQKPEMISGIFLGITFIVIRINLVFNTICQKKGHSFKAVDRFFPVRTILSERPQNHYMCGLVKEILTKVEATSWPDYVWPDVWSKMLKSNQQNEKTVLDD